MDEPVGQDKEDEMLALTQADEDKEIDGLMHELEACKAAIVHVTQECVELGKDQMQCQRMHNEIQVEVRVIFDQIDCITAELNKETGEVDTLKKDYSQERSRLLDIVPARTADAEQLVSAIIDLTNRPKELNKELEKIKRHKTDLQQQILMQEKNINALEKLSSGQASRVETLEKDIVELEGILHDTEEETHHLRESYQLLMHQIHQRREQIPKPHRAHRKPTANAIPHDVALQTTESTPPRQHVSLNNPRRGSNDTYNQTAADLIQSFQKRRYGSSGTSSKRRKTVPESPFGRDD